MNWAISEKMWGEKALHIPNINDVYGAELVGAFIDNYQTRIICLLAKEHKIILPERHREDVIKLLEYFQKIGIDHISLDNAIFIDDFGKSNFEISSLVLALGNDIDELNNPKYNKIIPFVSSSNVALVALKYKKKLEMSHSLSYLLNDKGHLRDILDRKKIRITGANRVSIYHEDYVQRAFDIYECLKVQGIKDFAVIIPKSCSGYGIHRFSTAKELHSILTLISQFDEFLIDPWYSDNVGSPSFQMYLGDKPSDDIYIGLTDQMLDGCTHLGNIYPSRYINSKKIKDICEKVIDELREQGARGMLGVDLLIRKINGKIIPYVLEVNARQTGAVYAGFLAYELRKGKKKPWIGHNNITLPPATSLNDYYNYLKENNAAYHMGDEEGIFIICSGNTKNNKIMILILAETTNRLYELLDIAEGMEKCSQQNL